VKSCLDNSVGKFATCISANPNPAGCNLTLLHSLRRIFGPKRYEDRSWRKLHNDELHSLYSPRNIVMVIKSRRMGWVAHVARMEKGRGVYRVLVGKPERKRPLGRSRRRWEGNIKVDLREIEIDGANWIRLPQDTVQWRVFVRAVMNLHVPQRKQVIV
jgi:hypothetical protein